MLFRRLRNLWHWSGINPVQKREASKGFFVDALDEIQRIPPKPASIIETDKTDFFKE